MLFFFFVLAQVLPNDDTLDNIDMFSDTTSMFSQFTRYTQASSRVSTVSSRASRYVAETESWYVFLEPVLTFSLQMSFLGNPPSKRSVMNVNGPRAKRAQCLKKNIWSTHSRRCMSEPTNLNVSLPCSQDTDINALTLHPPCVCIADYGNLLRAMVPFGYVEEARTSQVKFECFLKHLQDKIDEIFVPLQLLNGQVRMIKNK
jgi:elongator complex protein 1